MIHLSKEVGVTLSLVALFILPTAMFVIGVIRSCKEKRQGR